MTFNEVIDINKINIRVEKQTLGNLLGRPSVLIQEKSSFGSTADRVLNLISDPVIRRGDGVLISSAENEYLNKMKYFIDKNEPINIVFQGFAFKCHNPVETLRKTPDLGELATIKRIADINETVKKVYPPGLRFTALTEGRSYKDLFGASEKEVNLYLERCRYFAKLLGVESILKFIDFMDLIPDEKTFFDESRSAETGISQTEIQQFTPVMMRSMPIIEHVAFEDLLAIFGYGNDGALTEFQREFGEYIKLGATDLAIKYLAMQKVKKKHNIIDSHFPNDLYFSTTAKPNRYSFHPIHRKTRLYAHHGVPVLGSDKTEIVYLGEILKNKDIYTAVYLKDDIEDAPFYFLKGRQFIRK